MEMNCESVWFQPLVVWMLLIFSRLFWEVEILRVEWSTHTWIEFLVVTSSVLEKVCATGFEDLNGVGGSNLSSFRWHLWVYLIVSSLFIKELSFPRWELDVSRELLYGLAAWLIDVLLSSSSVLWTVWYLFCTCCWCYCIHSHRSWANSAKDSFDRHWWTWQWTLDIIRDNYEFLTHWSARTSWEQRGIAACIVVKVTVTHSV